MDRLWSGPGRDSILTFALGRPELVYAVRMKYSMDNQEELHLAFFEALWPRQQDDPWNPYEAFRCFLKLRTGPKVKTQTIWINRRIDRFHLRPDESPFTLRLKEITLLTQPGAGPRTPPSKPSGPP